MDPFTIAALLSVASGGINIAGQIIGGKAERDKARTEMNRSRTQQQWQKQQADWQKQQVGYQIEDTERQRDREAASLLTQSYAQGIGGPSVSAGISTTLGEFNRAISRLSEQQDQIDTQKGWIDTQTGWAQDDTNTFLKQSKVNQWLGIGGSLLTTGSNVYGMGSQAGWWGKTNTYTPLYGTGSSVYGASRG
jgi:hypothetical protein